MDRLWIRQREVLDLRDDCVHLTVACAKLCALAMHLAKQRFASSIHKSERPQIYMHERGTSAQAILPAITQLRYPGPGQPALKSERQYACIVKRGNPKHDKLLRSVQKKHAICQN